MNALLYVIGVLLVLIIVELLLLIIEVTKLSSALQHFLINRNEQPQQSGVDPHSLTSLLSQLKERGTKLEEAPEEQPAVSSGKTQESGTTEAGTQPSEEPAETEGKEEETAEQPSQSESQQSSSSSTQTASVRRPYAAQQSPSAPSETETSSSSFSVLACPSCGRENSSFRKNCYFCNASLQEGSS